MVIHFTNVFLSELFQGDPCTWYIISFLLDSTLGLFIIYVGIRSCQWLARRWGCEVLNFGEYGKPPLCKVWFGQCFIYIILMVIEKILMTFLIQWDIWNKVRQFIIPNTDPRLELTIVMLIIPFIVNVIMFWVVDNFLMHKRKKIEDGDLINNSRNRVRYKKLDLREECEAEILLITDDEEQGMDKNLQQRHLNFAAVT